VVFLLAFVMNQHMGNQQNALFTVMDIQENCSEQMANIMATFQVLRVLHMVGQKADNIGVILVSIVELHTMMLNQVRVQGVMKIAEMMKTLRPIFGRTKMK